MILRRNDTSASVTLPDDMYWEDEHKWTPLVVQSDYTLTGALVVEPSAKQAGRPITLSPMDRAIWVPRSTVETLLAWASIPGLELTWTFRSTSRTVMFAEDGVEAEPIMHIEPQESADQHALTLRLFEA